MKVLALFLSIILIISCSDEVVLTEEENCSLSELEEEVISELTLEHAHFFESAEPDIKEEALDSLVEYLGDAKIVGLGEATHGSAEFFKMKDKLFRSLVLDKDFKAIIFEVPWANALKVDDYVVKNKGTADAALNQTYYWVFDTEETRDLAVWMNEYNSTRDSTEKIHFVGCDPQGGNFEYEKQVVFDYLDKYSPPIKDSIYIRYTNLPYDLSNYSELPEEEISKHRENVAWAYNCLEEKREAFVSLSGGYEYEVALMAAHVIQHREYIYREKNFGQGRDSLMAVYSLWWQDILGPNAKVAVWAHNYHVMDNYSSPGSPWMGTYLRQSIGRDYKNVGFSFTTGGLNAWVAGYNGRFLQGVQPQYVTDSVCNSLNYLLSQVDRDQFYLIFEKMPNESPAKQFLFRDQEFYQMGSGFNQQYIHNYTSTISFPNLWDVMIHFDKVKRSELR